MDMIYLVLDEHPAGSYNIREVTEREDRAHQHARNIDGVAVGFPVLYLADFREDAP